ncbi:protease inhibitor I42 family protein [Hoeflea sp. WL0058]|uniref:Protease inhibitor I42 family protein n=1 Tax=Flavimaribacter sediminis TaxID=2865987 RepID=A0AAE3CYZ6_9HYPH|nr:protease inhibitor I42 family protein [Flavimaribacter sediminis]MBW8636114.1 protease inhibitor I42 family protein [Flavimaribacter sediminis]
MGIRAAIAGLLLSVSPATAETIDAVVGAALILRLDGTPSTGYTWSLIDDQSSGLDHLELKELGWAPVEESSAKVGAPQVLSIEVTPLAPGDAKLVYGYLRPWEDVPPAKTQSFEITIKDK